MTQLIAGGYADAGAAGLYHLTLGPGTISVETPFPTAVNVSGGVRVPGTTRWFLVDERGGCVMLVDAAAEWQVIAQIASGGDGPCHLAMSPDGAALAVAHYDSGHVAVVPVGADGMPGAAVTHQLVGSGPNGARQAGPHAHWVGYGADQRLYAVDLGSDQIRAFTDDAAAGPAVAFAAPPGSGPRQLVFHPALPRAYLVSELASTLTVLDTSEPTWRSVATCSTLPAGFGGESLGGAITIDPPGTRLHVSNRGHDSITTFALDRRGDADLHGHVASGGRSPRFLLLNGNQLLVAHEQAGGVTVLPLGPTGLPQAVVARATVPGAAFLAVTEP